ncbi:predicted protein, partial [Nematostella vectensis]
KVEIAVPSLLSHIKQKQSEKPSLMGDQQAIWVLVALKKIPAPDKKPKRIPLSSSLHSEDSEVCLITKLEGSKAKELLKSKDITSVKKVISLTKLRKNYRSFESKRQLSSLYDIFLCDDAIYHLLPRVLGKAFFAKKKFPLPVNLKKTNLQGEINKALQSTYISLGHGSCSAMKVGHTGQEKKEVISNIVEAVSGLAKIIPRGWNNIQSLNIKTSNSISLPIYNSL